MKRTIPFTFILLATLFPLYVNAAPQCVTTQGDGSKSAPIQLKNNELICEISMPTDSTMYFQYTLENDAPYGVFNLGYNDSSSARLMAKLDGIPTENKNEHDCISLPPTIDASVHNLSPKVKYQKCFMGKMKAGTWWVVIDTHGINLNGQVEKITGAAVLGTLIHQAESFNPFNLK